jgi:CheY-like chemotaxis protein
MPKLALVVDDSMLMRYSICRFLGERGFVVESATNGCEALEVLARVHPDVVITDMQMPKMSGSELITALKSRQETAAVPIIIVAGKGSGCCQTEKRADYIIYKDIDVETQLGKALDAVIAETGRAQASGK